MIQTAKELEVSLRQLMTMYEILSSQHAEIAPRNYKNYLIYSQGPMDEIVKLRREIDQYLGIDESAVLAAQPEPAEYRSE